MNKYITKKRPNKKQPFLGIPTTIVVALFLLGVQTPCVGEETKLKDNLTDLGGNNVTVSSIAGTTVVTVGLCKATEATSMPCWARVDSQVKNLQSAHLLDGDGKIWKVKFVNGHEFVGRPSGILSGKADIAGLSSVPYSITWSDIKDIEFVDGGKRKISNGKSGVTAHIRIKSGVTVDLASISFEDLHARPRWTGLWKGGRDDLLPVVVKDHEVDIPIGIIRTITFGDEKHPLVADVVYCPSSTQEAISLKGKKIGYRVDELRITGDNWMGSWRFCINRYVGHELGSIEMRKGDSKRKGPVPVAERRRKGVCRTWEQEEWQLYDLPDVEIAVKVGNARITLTPEKVRKVSVTRHKHGCGLEITLVNGEKIVGEGSISGEVSSVDRHGLSIKIPSSSIREIETVKTE